MRNFSVTQHSRYYRVSLISQQIKSKWNGTSKCLSDKKANIALLSSPLPIRCPGIAFRPSKRESDQQPEPATAAIIPCFHTGVFHCQKLDFCCGWPSLLLLDPGKSQVQPVEQAKAGLWRRLTLGTLPSWDLPLTSAQAL